MVSDGRGIDCTTAAVMVLILVLMEYGPCSDSPTGRGRSSHGLNPCSNGIWSLTSSPTLLKNYMIGLNPCSNGIWSLTRIGFTAQASRLVLILVLMEYGLWPSARLLYRQPLWRLNPCSNGIWSLTCMIGLMILIESSLNPCSNGIWSLTATGKLASVPLVCLNPCSNGIWSLTNLRRAKMYEKLLS